MRFWFDTEFIEDGRTIDLLSIGIVAEDGREYYAEAFGVDHSKASPWVAKNVLPHLTGVTMLRRRIAQEIVDFVGKSPEFWGYYADYDWVVLCQLYGTMMDLPKGWPMFCLDIRQLLLGASGPPIPEDNTHHALADARWNKAAWYSVRGAHLDAVTHPGKLLDL